MAKQEQPPLSEKERQARAKKKADSFWNIFLPTKDGKVKSTLIVNSFCFSVLCLAVYIVCYLLLIDVLHEVFAAHTPVWLNNLIGSVFPALIGTAACCSFHFLFREKKIIPAAYTWQLLYAIGAILYILIGLPQETRAFAVNLLVMVVPAPLISGCALSAFLYLRHRKKMPQGPVEELPPWKRRKTAS